VNPWGVAVDSAGSLYIADAGNNRIRKVSNGVVTTAAGNGEEYGFIGDNGSAISAELNYPSGVAVDAAGNIYIADTSNNRIRKVSNGVITTVAGSETVGFIGHRGDGGPATAATLNQPSGVALDSAANLYIADTVNQRIRKVSNGVITTVAGNGALGFSGDNGPATSATLDYPEGIAVDSAGNLYIADDLNNRIRKVANGVITTVVGTGTGGFSGDNGSATSAELYGPFGVAVDSTGNLYIADTANERIRKVSNGVITTVAGNGALGFGGDGGPATSAYLNQPLGVTVDSSGNVYIADTYNDRVRILTNGPFCSYSVVPASLQAPAAGGDLTVGIQTGDSCPWAVSELPSWITISGATSGTGSATVTLVLSPNSSAATASATIFIAGVSVTITQPAAPLPTIAALVNAAGFQSGPISPGEIITIGGAGLGPSTPAGLVLDQDGKSCNVGRRSPGVDRRNTSAIDLR
jgi:sugar lactone lactonase YvrE